MRSFCRPNGKLASPWFPPQKVNGIFALGFRLLQKISCVKQNVWCLHILFSKINFTDEQHFIRAANNNYFHSQLTCWLFYRLINSLFCWSVIPKAQDDILKCLFLSTTQRYSVHCHRGGKKPENIHFEEAKIREFWLFSLKSTQTDESIIKIVGD